MPYAVVKGARLYWEERGQGPPVLLIAGLTFSLEMWFRILPSLANEYRTIIFDNRGVGRSDVPPGPYSVGQMARDAASILDAAGALNAHVIGASMGGMIAQELALRYPARVRSLVLACTSHSGLFGRWPRISKLQRALLPGVSRLEREALLVPLLYAATTPRSRIEEDLAIRRNCHWTNRSFWNQFLGILGWSAYRRLPLLEVPALVVHGAEDHLIPAANGRSLAARIRSAEYHLIPDAGHIISTDQPELSTHLLLDFLRRQPSIAN